VIAELDFFIQILLFCYCLAQQEAVGLEVGWGNNIFEMGEDSPNFLVQWGNYRKPMFSIGGFFILAWVFWNFLLISEILLWLLLYLASCAASSIAAFLLSFFLWVHDCYLGFGGDY
jgi:hypothetical protein